MTSASADRPPWPARFAGPHNAGARVLACAVLAAVQLAGTVGAAHGQHGRIAPDALALALALVGPVALAVPGRPEVALIASVAAASAYLALGYTFGPVVLSAAVALVLAVQAGRRVEAWLVAAAGWGSTLLLSQLGPRPLQLGSGAGFAVWLAALLAIAEAARGRREAARVWARARAEERRRQAGEERLQIARDLHDGVAHQISLISVRAGVALHLLDGGGQSAQREARAALAAIREASGEALVELRGALALLRADGEPAPRHPAPGLGGLAGLVQQWDGAGLLVSVTGDAGPLPAAVDQVAYRVVQEALTNVSLHSAATRADVELSRDGEQLIVTVTDPGPVRLPDEPPSGGRGGPAPRIGPEPGPRPDPGPDPEPDPESGGGGRGLVGMRERVGALGGAVVAGPLPVRGTPGGREPAGWRVRAVLPVGPTGAWRPDLIAPVGAVDGTRSPAARPVTGPTPAPVPEPVAGPGDDTVELAAVRAPTRSGG